MDSTIVAALISGGVGAVGIVGTVVTSVVGSKDTRKATEQAITAGSANTRATLTASREDRLWERRAAAYEDTVAGLLHRQRKRQRGVVLYKGTAGIDPQRLRDYLASFESPDWIESQTRLVPYASETVLAASNASQEADDQVWWVHNQWLGMIEANRQGIEAGDPQAAFDAEALLQARKEVTVALETAGTLDQSLIDLMRDELRSKPESAITPLVALPAVRRGLLRRRRS